MNRFFLQRTNTNVWIEHLFSPSRWMIRSMKFWTTSNAIIIWNILNENNRGVRIRTFFVLLHMVKINQKIISVLMMLSWMDINEVNLSVLFNKTFRQSSFWYHLAKMRFCEHFSLLQVISLLLGLSNSIIKVKYSKLNRITVSALIFHQKLLEKIESDTKRNRVRSI